MTDQEITREQWLVAAINRFRPLYAALGHDLPPVRVSMGFPGGGSRRTRIGECWHGSASADGIGQLFISPIIDDAARILDILAHELIHSINHAEGHTGHGKEFAAIAKPLGLVGKMTATVAGDELKATLVAMAAELGPFPHAALTPGGGPTKKQTTRMLKLTCDCCGYAVRTTQKHIDAGLPSCPRGTMMILAES